MTLVDKSMDDTINENVDEKDGYGSFIGNLLLDNFAEFIRHI